MKGLVIKSTGSSYIVRLDDGSDGIRGIRSTNPVAVGDYVEISLTGDAGPTAQAVLQQSGLTGDAGHIGWITDVCERRNYIIRKSTNLSKESHILAANIDQVALLVTVNHPATSTTFIDRFLATCEAYRVRAILIFNKTDLLTDEELERLAELRALYESIGYETMAISAKNLTDKVGLLRLLQGRVTLFSGNSGVGKSTLLNALFGREVTRTGKISDVHNTGMHTTTFSEMYCLSDEGGQPTQGWVIDTPGIKGFGTIDFEREEVSHYFPEIFEASRECRFGNCTHTNEPGCAVQEKLITGDIAISRYESYLSILNDSTEGKYRA